MQRLRKIIIPVLAVLAFIAVCIFAFYISLPFVAETTGNEYDMRLAELAGDYDVELGKLYSVSGVVENMYFGSSLENDKTVETVYVSLDNGVSCIFYSDVPRDIKGKTVELKGRAKFDGGIVVLENCTFIDKD